MNDQEFHDSAFHDFASRLFDETEINCDNVHPLVEGALNDASLEMTSDDFGANLKASDLLSAQILACMTGVITEFQAEIWDAQRVVGETEDEIDEDDPEYWLTLEDISEIIYDTLVLGFLMMPLIKAEWEAKHGKK